MALDIRPKGTSRFSRRRDEAPFSFVSPITFPEKEVRFVERSVTPAPSSGSPRKKKGALVLGLIMLLLLFGIGAYGLKKSLIENALRGSSNLEKAVTLLKDGDATGAHATFTQSRIEFERANLLLFGWGNLLPSLSFFPGLGQAASGKSLVESGVHFARAGEELTLVSGFFSEKFQDSKEEMGKTPSLLGLLNRSDAHIEKAYTELRLGDESLKQVREKDIPEEKKEKFRILRENLPAVVGSLKLYLDHSSLFEELLGGNGPRKYLFLFQNNNELRATGGFIGTYALLDVAGGDVRRFFVDGIFNPDGQLREKIVPPGPIQKISAAWSLHDSNWFPDFPLSAEKAMFFYEKTGGATVDGVITLTPTIMKRLLAVTGPIELPGYGVTIDTENFIPIIQEQVEEKYDRTENNPKKILSDLTDALFAHLLGLKDPSRLKEVGNALVSALNERHILLYSRHEATEALIDAAGWSGRVLDTPHDYLSVIHSNINGYKTDGVVSETINHMAEIQADGSIIDTVSITRRHNGGNTPYDWWNKVNADYMRVYVPEGSELLSAEGMTREVNKEPLDYAALGFKRDPLVEKEEKEAETDPESGTRISRESGKTVFGNWVYVSPQESVTVKYRYRLREKITLPEKSEPFSFSILYQKQAGTEGVLLNASLTLPEGYEAVWQTGKNLVRYMRAYQLKTTLDQNQFLGAVIQKL